MMNRSHDMQEHEPHLDLDAASDPTLAATLRLLEARSRALAPRAGFAQQVMAASWAEREAPAVLARVGPRLPWRRMAAAAALLLACGGLSTLGISLGAKPLAEAMARHGSGTRAAPPHAAPTRTARVSLPEGTSAEWFLVAIMEPGRAVRASAMEGPDLAGGLLPGASPAIDDVAAELRLILGDAPGPIEG